MPSAALLRRQQTRFAGRRMEEAGRHDLILIGAAREGLRQRFLFGQAVLMVKNRQPTTGSRLFH